MTNQTCESRHYRRNKAKMESNDPTPNRISSQDSIKSLRFSATC